MKISYNWLKEFIDLKISPEQLAEDLSLFGHQVESIHKTNADYILDLEITPNRGDLLSIYGMAREVAALYKLKVKNEKLKIKVKSEKLNKKIHVKISDPAICPRFTARIIDDIKIGESPKWIKDRLLTYGFRPINNIVDITNYVMIETGQPLHAFDYDKIHQGKMNIRLAMKNEFLTTLDNKKRYLDENAIIIEDDKKLYDLAGIMGGANSEVDQKTKTIVLQGAIFDPVLIRRTSKKLNLTTDASYRYEREVDYEGTIYGVNRATQLIQKICPKTKIGPLYDMQSKKKLDNKIKIEIKKINNLLGTKFTVSKIADYLERLNIQYTNGECLIPSYRQFDLKIWQDVAEEVARVYGYNNLEQARILKTKPKINKEYTQKEYIKDILVNNGFTETYSYSFTDEKLLNLLKVDFSQCRQVVNSIAPELKYLRTDLRSSVLSAAAKNPWSPDIKIFEIGHIFNHNSEKEQIAIAVTGKSDQLLKNLIKLLNLRTEIKSFDQRILDHLKIRRPVKYLLYDLEKIKIMPQSFKNKFSAIKYKKASEFPPTIRDLAFIVDCRTNSQEIASYIKALSQHILLTELFDEFASDKFGKNKKNVAYHVWLQDLKKPMKDTTVNIVIKKIINKIEHKFKAKLRS